MLWGDDLDGGVNAERQCGGGLRRGIIAHDKGEFLVEPTVLRRNREHPRLCLQPEARRQRIHRGPLVGRTAASDFELCLVRGAQGALRESSGGDGERFGFANAKGVKSGVLGSGRVGHMDGKRKGQIRGALARQQARVGIHLKTLDAKHHPPTVGRASTDGLKRVGQRLVGGYHGRTATGDVQGNVRCGSLFGISLGSLLACGEKREPDAGTSHSTVDALTAAAFEGANISKWGAAIPRWGGPQFTQDRGEIALLFQTKWHAINGS